MPLPLPKTSRAVMEEMSLFLEAGWTLPDAEGNPRREYRDVEGDPATALLAWRSLAGGMAASRFLFGRPSASREQAKDEIARLVAVDGAAAIDANLSSDELAADHRRLLNEEASPHPFWATALLLGFVTWVAFLLLLAQQRWQNQTKTRNSLASEKHLAARNSTRTTALLNYSAKVYLSAEVYCQYLKF